jgi:TonB family protein
MRLPRAALPLVLLAVAASSAAAQDRVRKDGDTLEFLDEPAASPGETPAAPAADVPFGPDTVRQTVEAHQAEVTGCYETILAQGAAPQGEVRVRFTVGRNGLVSRAAVARSTLKQPRVEACIVQAVRRWPFPKPARPTTIVFPFRLSVDRARGQDREQVVDPPGDEDPPPPAAPGAPAPEPRR